MKKPKIAVPNKPKIAVAAASTKKPRVLPRIKQVEEPHPVYKAFLDRNRHAYIRTALPKTPEHPTTFVTMRSGEIDVVSLLPGRCPPADTEAQHVKFNSDVMHVGNLLDYVGPRSVKQIAEQWERAFLNKTPKGLAALCQILDKPVPEIPPEIVQKRKAAGERLKASKGSIPTKPSDNQTVTLVAEKTQTPPTARAALIVKLLSSAKKNSMTVGAISTALKKPCGAAVATLASLHFVSIK